MTRATAVATTAFTTAFTSTAGPGAGTPSTLTPGETADRTSETAEEQR